LKADNFLLPDGIPENIPAFFAAQSQAKALAPVQQNATPPLRWQPRKNALQHRNMSPAQRHQENKAPASPKFTIMTDTGDDISSSSFDVNIGLNESMSSIQHRKGYFAPTSKGAFRCRCSSLQFDFSNTSLGVEKISLVAPDGALFPLVLGEIGGTGYQQRNEEMGCPKSREHIPQQRTFVGLLCTWKLLSEYVSFVWLCNFILKNMPYACTCSSSNFAFK
jgi:hypothetical protein